MWVSCGVKAGRCYCVIMVGPRYTLRNCTNCSCLFVFSLKRNSLSLSLSLENLITRRSSFKGCLFSRLLGKVFYRLFVGWTVKVSHLNGGVISAIQFIHKHNCINHHVSNLINTKSNLRVVLEFMLLCLFFVGSRHWIPVIKLIIPN